MRKLSFQDTLLKTGERNKIENIICRTEIRVKWWCGGETDRLMDRLMDRQIGRQID